MPGIWMNAMHKAMLGDIFFNPKNVPFPPKNGIILNITKIIKQVMLFAAESELCALYIKECKTVKIQNILQEMGYPQPPMLMQSGSFTAEGIFNSHVHPRHTKEMDMHLHWLWYRGMLQEKADFLVTRENTLQQQLVKTPTIHPSSHNQNRISDALQRTSRAACTQKGVLSLAAHWRSRRAC